MENKVYQPTIFELLEDKKEIPKCEMCDSSEVVSNAKYRVINKAYMNEPEIDWCEECYEAFGSKAKIIKEYK